MNVLITGANRGIGLEFVRTYSQQHRVFACCRNPQKAEELVKMAAQSNDNITVHALDVADHKQIDDLAGELEDAKIDILINNAGVYGKRTGFGNTDYDDWMTTLRINTMASMKMAEAFVEHLAAGKEKKQVIVTSKMGSIADNTSGGSYVYRSSKAAVNAVNKSLSNDLSSRGIISIVIHPGWVVTDMGGPNALINAEQSVRGMCEVIAGLSLSDSGKFYSYNGSEIPW